MVAAASEEQPVTSEQIARSVEMISNVSGESAQGISQIAGAADDLNRITSDLDDKIRRFRIKSDARSARSQTNGDRKSTRLNSSHVAISYAVFCLKKRRS